MNIYDDIDFVKGVTAEQWKLMRSMKAEHLCTLINVCVAEINKEMKCFLIEQKKWEEKGTIASLKSMRKSLLNIGKMQRAFQCIRMEYLVARSREEGEKR